MSEERKIKKSGGVFQVAGLLMFTMSLSRLFGYVRDIVLTSNFGQDYRTDAYFAAFSIPDFIYYLLVGGALSAAFIPIFSSYVAKKEEEDGWIVASTILNIVMIFASVLIGLGLIFTEPLVRMLVQFEGEAFDLTVMLTRVMFAQSFFMCLNGIAQGICHSYNQFTAPAIGSVVYNVAIVVVGLLLNQQLGILGFSIGVVVGAFLNFAIQIPTLIRLGFRYRLVLDLHHAGVKKFFSLLGPVLLGLSVTHLNLFIGRNLGSGLEEGTLSALQIAQRIMQMPIGIFAIAIALAVFPTMTGHAARGEMKEFRRDLSMGFRTIIFITLPCAIGLIVLRTPIVRAMYQQAAFTEANTEVTATALLFYSLGLIGYSTQQVLNRGFYAIQDTKSPVTINLVAIVLNIVLSILLVGPLGYRGLALAYSLSGLVSMILLLVALRQKLNHFGGNAILMSFMKACIAAAAMWIVVYFLGGWIELHWDMTNKLYQIGQVAIGIVVGASVYGMVALLLKMEEVEMVLGIVRRKLKRKK